jgi:hypothetical protein
VSTFHPDAPRIFAGLKDNGFFGQYVKMLEAQRDKVTKQLLYSPMPDEALRGEARAYDLLLKEIRTNTK